ncbi:unnamed protein product, partial [Polarella glacialis]
VIGERRRGSEGEALTEAALVVAGSLHSGANLVALMPSEKDNRPRRADAGVNVDVDFVQLAKQLRSVGQEVIAVLLEGPAFRCPESVALSKAFEEIGVDVFWVGVEWFEFRRPLMKAVLNPELG